jgi:SAM-dependent methyltransferase
VKKADDPEFDRYAHSYKELHKHSVQASGEEPDYFAAYKAAYMAGSVGHLSGSPLDILDFGCGVGGSTPHLRNFFPNAEILGMDVSGESIALARAANTETTYTAITGDALDLPDNSVDIAMAACVYHHIPPEQRPGWTRELKRVLRPGGRFFLFEHNPLNPLTRKVVNECPFDEDAILLKSSESAKLLADAGFRQAKISYIVFFPKAMAGFRPLESYLSWLPLGAQYVAHGVA